MRNVVDMAMHVTTTHYHIDVAMKPKESKRIMRKTIPYLITAQGAMEMKAIHVN